MDVDWSGGGDDPHYSPEAARTSPVAVPANLASMYANADNCPMLFMTQDRRECLSSLEAVELLLADLLGLLRS